VSEDTTGQDTSETGEADMKSARELHTESHDPAVPEAYSAFMRSGWDDREVEVPRHEVAAPAATRRAKLAAMFPGERLVLPAGTFKVRANDTDYKFRPDTAHTYFSGNQTSDAVLVVEAGEAVLYARPRSGRDSDEFFRDRQYGQLWVGRRPSLRELSDALGIECRHIDRLQDALTANTGTKTRVLRGIAADVDRMVAADDGLDEDLQRVVGELRLVKDDWEVAQLREACEITALGFEDSVREWKQVLEYG
jgi:Xaa-Pro aminopeptidase